MGKSPDLCASPPLRGAVRLFLSSTYRDLKPYRDVLISALEGLPGAVRERMEVFGADPNAPKAVCLDRVRRSNLFVSIIGMSYGTIDRKTGKSLTQLEYEEAQKSQLPTWVYEISGDRQPILPIHVDTGPKAEKLRRFKAKMRRKHTCEPFTTPDNLAFKVLKDVLPHVFQMAGTQNLTVAYDLGPILHRSRERRGEALSSVLARVRANKKLREVLSQEVTWYEQLERGRQAVAPELIPAIALAYEIDPSIVQPFAANAIPGIVNLRGNRDFVESTMLAPGVRKTYHRIARNRLLGSRISVLRVRFPEGARSITHRHPGEEIVIGIRGKVRLVFPERTGAQKHVTVAAGDVLHFDATQLHRAEHAEGDPAVNLAIRIIDPGELLTT